MIIELGVRVPLTDLKLEAMLYDPEAQKRDHAVAMGHQGQDVVRDANKPSASLRREGALDHLLNTPSPLDDLLKDDSID